MRLKKRREIPITSFAPAQRVPIQIVHRQATAVAISPLGSSLPQLASAYVFVVNAQRQIVFASRNADELAPGRNMIGMRPGEALCCIHVHEGHGGCGTSKACRRCGALNGILRSFSGEVVSQQFHCTRMIRCRQEILEFQVIASPLTCQGELFSLLVLTRGSTADAKRIVPQLPSSVPGPLGKHLRSVWHTQAT